MLEYLEKQMILSFHFRGEQEEFEKEFPELVSKAKKYLGYELYYALAPFETGNKKLNPDSADPREVECYQSLADLQDKLNVMIDDFLKKQNIAAWGQ